MTPGARLAILAGLALGFVVVWALAALIGGGWPNVQRNLPLIALGIGVLAAVLVTLTWLMSWLHPLLVLAAFLVFAVIGWRWGDQRTRRQPAEVREAQRKALEHRRPLAIVLTAIVLAYVAAAMYVAVQIVQPW
jgi:heme/copper-type cytochrome/quinol oxidase subunit 2